MPIKSDKLVVRSAGAEEDRQALSVDGRYAFISDTYTTEAESTLRDYWHVLLKRRWTVAACVVVISVLVAIVTFRMTRMYQSTARIAIYHENSEYMGFKEMAATDSSYDADYTVELDTQIGVLQSDTLALDVIRKLDLANNPNFSPRSKTNVQAVSDSTAQDDAREAALLGAFRSGLTIAKVPHTKLVELRYSNPNPKLAAQIANALATSFIEHNFRTKYESASQASEWLGKQLADLQMKVASSQEALVKYQKEHGIVGLDEKQNIVTSKLDELNKELTTAEADRIQKEAAYRLVSSGNNQLLSTQNSGSNYMLDKLREEQATVKTQLAQVTTQFGPAYPKVRELTNQYNELDAAINTEFKKTESRYKNDYEAALTRERMLRTAFEDQKQQANKLNENAIEYTILKRDADSSRQLYDGLLQKMKEAGVSAGLKSDNIRIVDVARVPRSPSKPNVPMNLGLGFAASLMTGVLLAFVLERIDNTIRTPEEVQKLSRLPALGVVPLNTQMLRTRARARLSENVSQKDQKETELIAYLKPKSQLAECYRSIRTSILLSASGAPPQALIVTSSLPQEGKTTTSINTAIVLAQRGSKVLLIDGDMRRPAIHKHLGLKNTLGLSTVLSGGATLDQVIVPTHIDNLYCIPSGMCPPHPAELISSATMKEALAVLRTKFDHIIIDTPPILSVTDGVVLSVEVDGVVLVARSGHTRKEALRRGCDLLRYVNARIIGVIVNAMNMQSDGYYYYYYYGKKGAPGYYGTNTVSEAEGEKDLTTGTV